MVRLSDLSFILSEKVSKLKILKKKNIDIDKNQCQYLQKHWLIS